MCACFRAAKCSIPHENSSTCESWSGERSKTWPLGALALPHLGGQSIFRDARRGRNEDHERLTRRDLERMASSFRERTVRRGRAGAEPEIQRRVRRASQGLRGGLPAGAQGPRVVLVRLATGEGAAIGVRPLQGALVPCSRRAGPIRRHAGGSVARTGRCVTQTACRRNPPHDSRRRWPPHWWHRPPAGTCGAFPFGGGSPAR